MKWLEDMNSAIEYIENNLEGKIDYAKISQKASCSVYNFQRIFSFIARISLAEYIRRRKMTVAAFELQNSKIKIVDLAIKYGYDSPEAFTRAFQNLHGITPTEARKQGTNIKAFPRISFQISIKGDCEMNYKIVKKENFQVYGIERIFDMENNKNLIEIPDFWTEIIQNGEFDKLIKSANYPSLLNSVCSYRNINETTFPYMICTMKTPLSDTTGYTIVDIPDATWAIFTNEPHKIEETSNKVQELISCVYTDWIPTSNYEIVPGFEFEMYYDTSLKEVYEEVWYRVSPKE